MTRFDDRVREAHRITQESGLKLKERVGIIDPTTMKPRPGIQGSRVCAISGSKITIAFASGDEMEADTIDRNLLYSLCVVERLIDGASAQEIITRRKRICTK